MLLLIAADMILSAILEHKLVFCSSDLEVFTRRAFDLLLQSVVRVSIL